VTLRNEESEGSENDERERVSKKQKGGRRKGEKVRGAV